MYLYYTGLQVPDATVSEQVSTYYDLPLHIQEQLIKAACKQADQWPGAHGTILLINRQWNSIARDSWQRVALLASRFSLFGVQATAADAEEEQLIRAIPAMLFRNIADRSMLRHFSMIWSPDFQGAYLGRMPSLLLQKILTSLVKSAPQLCSFDWLGPCSSTLDLAAISALTGLTS